MWVLALIVIFFLYLFFKKGENSNNSYSESNFKYQSQGDKNKNLYYKRNYGRYFNNYSVTSLIDKNEILINHAIKLNNKIHFKYRDKEKNFTERTVTPLRLFIHTFGDDGEMLCMEAFCHLRNANRTFALFRMNSLRMI